MSWKKKGDFKAKPNGSIKKWEKKAKEIVLKLLRSHCTYWEQKNNVGFLLGFFWS